MKEIRILLGNVDAKDVVAGWGKLDDGTRDALIIIAVLVVVTVAAITWAFMMGRNKRNRRHSHHHLQRARRQPEGRVSRAALHCAHLAVELLCRLPRGIPSVMVG